MGTFDGKKVWERLGFGMLCGRHAVSIKVTVGDQRTVSTRGSWKEGEPQKEEGTGGVIREAPSVLFKPTYSSTLSFSPSLN